MIQQARSIQLKWFASILFPLLILFLPESETFTWHIKLFLAITLFGVMGYALEFTDNLVISLLMTFLYGVAGVAKLPQVLSPWLSPVAWMTLGALIIVSIVQKTTILKRMAYQAAIKTNGNYMLIVLGVATVALIARFFLQGTMACIAVVVISYGLCEALKLGKSRASAGIMLVTVISYMDANFFIYSPDFISILYNAAEPIQKITPSYPKFFMDNIVFVVCNYVVAAAIAVYCKPDKPLSGREEFEERLRQLGVLNANEWKIIIVLIALVLFLYTNQFHHIDMVYGFIFAPMLLYFPGMDVGTRQDLKDVQYSILIFITACMGIGAAGSAAHFDSYISQLIVPHLQGMSQPVFLSVTYISGVLLNLLMTPLAALASFGLPFAQICHDLNFSMEAMFYTFYQGAAQLWMPYETANYLVAYSFGLMWMRDFVIIMSIKFIIDILFLATIGIGWWSIVGVL